MFPSTTRSEVSDEAVVEKLNRLKVKMKNSDTLSSDEVSDVIEGILESMDTKLQSAETELRTREVDLKLANAQRYHWESEAKQLAMQLNEMKEQRRTQIEPPTPIGADATTKRKQSPTNSSSTLEADLADMKQMNQKMKQCMLNLNSDRKELKLKVARLKAEMKEIKRENEDLVEMVNKKEAETMDMITQLNKDMNSSINQNQHASCQGTTNYQHQTTTTLFAARMGSLSGKLRAFMHAGEAREKPDDMTEATILDSALVTTHHSNY